VIGYCKVLMLMI